MNITTPTQPRWKKGDVVRLTDGRDAGNTATVRAESRGGVCLETPLGGYFQWNEADLESVEQARRG